MPNKTGEQTRQEHYDECEAEGHPLPEIITEHTVVGRDASGNKLLARDEDVNTHDVRDVFDDGTYGPWRKA